MELELDREDVRSAGSLELALFLVVGFFFWKKDLLGRAKKEE